LGSRAAMFVYEPHAVCRGNTHTYTHTTMAWWWIRGDTQAETTLTHTHSSQMDTTPLSGASRSSC